MQTTRRPPKTVTIVTMIVSMGATFALDMFMPRAYAPWLLYAVPIGLALRLRWVPAPLVTAGTCAGLLVLGGWLSPGPLLTEDLINRSLGLAIGTLIGLILFQYRRTEQHVIEQQEQFREIAENIREVFWISSPDKSGILYISPGYETIWGRSCQSLYDAPQSWMHAIHEEDRDRVQRAALEKQVGGTYDEEYRILLPDGTLRWIRDRAFPLKDAAGKVSRIVGIAEDITERKLALERLACINDCFLNFGPSAARNIDSLVSASGLLLGATCAQYSRLHDGTLATVVSRWQVPHTMPLTREAAGHLCASVIQSPARGLTTIRYLQESRFADTDDAIRPSGFQTYLGYPVRVRGKTVGALCALYRWDLIPTPAQDKLMGIIASAIGVEEERQRAQNELEAHEAQLSGLLEDRERIQLDLHDDIIQSLYAIGLNLEESRLRLSATTPQEADRTARAIDQLNEVIRHIRENILSARPRLISNTRLASSIAALVDRVEHDAPALHVDLAPDLVAALSAQQATHLLYVAQEAFANCIRHAHARTVRVALQRADEGLRFIVEDDGRGFETSRPDGHGLANIRVRAMLLGGDLQVESAAERGTRLTVQFPFRTGTHDEAPIQHSASAGG